MSIATRFPKSWSIPKFDIKDSSLVFYLPLWYPYSDTADPTTIYSYDKTRYSCTVVSVPSLQPDGRLFDSVDDTIQITSATDLQTANGLIMFWANSTTLANTLYVYSHASDELSVLRVFNTSNYAFYYDGSAVFTLTGTSLAAEWVCIGASFTQNGTGYGYENGVQVASGACSATAPATNANAYIGSLADAGNYWRGKIGEVVKYSGTYTQAESDAIMKRYYQVTRWRYK